jgi:hypothetical protein
VSSAKPTLFSPLCITPTHPHDFPCGSCCWGSGSAAKNSCLSVRVCVCVYFCGLGCCRGGLGLCFWCFSRKGGRG